MKELSKIRQEKSKLKYEIGTIAHKIKSLETQERNEIVNKHVDYLLTIQEQEGNLNQRTLFLFLNDLATEIRNLYNG